MTRVKIDLDPSRILKCPKCKQVHYLFLETGLCFFCTEFTELLEDIKNVGPIYQKGD